MAQSSKYFQNDTPYTRLFELAEWMWNAGFKLHLYTFFSRTAYIRGQRGFFARYFKKDTNMLFLDSRKITDHEVNIWSAR